MQPALAQIAVDQEDGPADLGQRQRQVAGHRGFALARVGAGQHDEAGAVAVLPGIQNRGQRGPERVGQHREAFPRSDQFHLPGAFEILQFDAPGCLAFLVVGEMPAPFRIEPKG